MISRNYLEIDDSIIKMLSEKLLEYRHICIIGGSKCGKSMLAISIIDKLASKYGSYREYEMDKISGVGVAKKFVFPGMATNIVFLKNVSGMTLLDLEMLCRKYYVISTFPIQSASMLPGRFQAFDSRYSEIPGYNNRLWDCIPVVVQNEKLGNGRVYSMEIFKTEYHNEIINKQMICYFSRERSLFDEDYMLVKGKYVWSRDDLI